MYTPIPFAPARIAARWINSSAFSAAGDTYVQYLTERGYTAATIGRYFSAVAHFAHWSGGQETSLSCLDENQVNQFIEIHLPDCRCARRCERTRHTVRAALRQLLSMLRAQGQCAPQRASPPDSIAAELAVFDDYLANVRGLSPATRSLRVRHVRHFLKACFSDDSVQISSLGRVDVAHFIAHYAASWTPASLRVICTSLRSYFNYRASKGEQTTTLSNGLPQVAQWRLSGLPRQLSKKEINQLLGAFDRSNATGRRDYAITRCFVDLGLRSIEVSRLRLDDVDWRAGTLTIRSKGQRIDVLPLPKATGRAIVEYLKDGRPQTSCRELFVRHRPPINTPATAGIARNAVRYAAARSGLSGRVPGPHILRHTLAGELVQCGARFKEIADLMRHRSLDTTTIYAKVDFPTLEQVALPWPGRQS